jgi:tetratricopeptide (TPR) repeat protein
VREVASSNLAVPTIFPFIMPLIWKTFFFALVVTSLLFLAWILYYPKPEPQNQGEALSRMIALQENGRYDESIQTIKRWLQNNRRDPSRDAWMYHQIAMVYIIEAYERPKTRDNSIRQAEVNLERSLSLHDQQETEETSPDLLGIGGGYEVLGDLSDTEKCKFYEKGQLLFERQLPLIKGDTYTAYGTTVPLEPFRAEVRKHLDAVRQKLSNAGCPTN